MKVKVLRKAVNLSNKNVHSNVECEQNGGNCCAAGYCCQKNAIVGA